MELRRTISLIAVVVSVIAVLSASLLLADELKWININRASVDELMELKWIGRKLAQRIVEYREKNGPFEKPEDITLVSGIGPRAWEANKDRIVVE